VSVTDTVIELIRGGTTLVLTSGNYGIARTSGLGLSPLHRLSNRGPMQHGASDRGYRLDPRTILLSVNVYADSVIEHWERRAELLSMLAPSDGPLILRVTYPGTLGDIVRQIDVHATGGGVFDSVDFQAWSGAVPMQLRAADPTFYDPVAEAVTWALGGSSGGFGVPGDIPTDMGASTLDQTYAITYAGSAPGFPMIRITGPITDCVITNETTSEVLDFTGVTIADGHYYDLDLSYGVKSVLLDGITNKVADLTSASNLSSWHLAAATEPGGGINSLRATGSAADSATRIDLTYFNRYVGI
jgi:hypothetical protein